MSAFMEHYIMIKEAHCRLNYLWNIAKWIIDEHCNQNIQRALMYNSHVYSGKEVFYGALIYHVLSVLYILPYSSESGLHPQSIYV